MVGHCCACHLFVVDDAFAKHKHIDLVSGGLDTVAEVYLNDILVLQANNMFRRYVKDVKKVIKVFYVYVYHSEITA